VLDDLSRPDAAFSRAALRHAPDSARAWDGRCETAARQENPRGGGPPFPVPVNLHYTWLRGGEQGDQGVSSQDTAKRYG